MLATTPPVSRSAVAGLEAEARAHGLRVGALSERIAEALGMSPLSCRRLAAAAIPHDIGKARIPAEIVLWPGPLGDAQIELMRSHTVTGERLAQRFSGDYGILAGAIARSHHERFDGHGYPDGLAGNAIPVAVAIVSVADVFDALTSDRAYRTALSEAEALAIMRRERGKQFAPAVLDAFLALFKRPLAVAPRPTGAPAPALAAATFRYRRAVPRTAIAS